MVVLGRVIAPFGVKGWIRIKPFTEAVDGLLDYPVWWLSCASGWEEWKVEEAQVHGAVVVAKLLRCGDRDVAALLKGRDVAVPRKEMPRPASGEYYWTDLIGAAVLNLQGETLGRIERLLETGANDVMVVSGDRERLIPWVDAVVRDVDLARGEVRVEWGLDW